MKSIFEQFGGTYHREGDYLLPDIALPDEDEEPIGIWGQRHERWLKQEHRGLYHSLSFTYQLHDHLAEVDERAERMFTQLIDELAKREGVTEALKSANQMEWVRRMNSIRSRVEEIINAEVIFSI